MSAASAAKTKEGRHGEIDDSGNVAAVLPSRAAQTPTTKADNEIDNSCTGNHNKQQKDLIENYVPDTTMIRNEGVEFQTAKEIIIDEDEELIDVATDLIHHVGCLANISNAEGSKNIGANKFTNKEFDVMDVVHLRASLASNGDLPDVTYEPMPMPTPAIDNNDDGTATQSPHPQHQQPGAFSGAPGQPLHRRDNISFSLVGVAADHNFNSNSGLDDSGASSNQVITNPNTDSDVSLAEATPVVDHEMEAEPLDIAALQRKKEELIRKKRIFYGTGLLLLVVVLIILVVLAVTVSPSSNNDVSPATIFSPSTHPTTSPTISLPPMQNLELLYDALPPKTKESLYNNDSPQHKAWQWLLDHPNITTLEEWRKEQLFAMVTLFYSFQGPSWPETVSGRNNRWLNYAIHECSWCVNDVEFDFLMEATIDLIGPVAYSDREYQPCNPEGKVQSIFLRELDLPTHLQATMPPEIQMLTLLKILGITFSQLNAKLSDFFGVPEFINLPNLEALNFYENGLTGTIPQQMFRLTNLRHHNIGGNTLSGRIPSEISRMSSLEYLNVHQAEGIGGHLPSQFGLMTALTGLDVSWSTFSGTIPTELGSLTNMKKLTLDKNRLGGTIPSQLGLLTANTWLALYQNRLSGSIPSELGLATDTVRFRIWNNALDGSVPSEIGLMKNVIDFRIGNELELGGPRNDFSGSLPIELWEFSHLQWLHLSNLPNLHGRIPPEIMMPNLIMFSLSGSPHLSGTVPESICSVEDLDFDCSDLLCGCDCECMVS